jgi:hypothetical protein
MADSKISALPASTTPLAGSEVLPIVQSSTTKQVTVANLTAGRAISAASVTASTGNFVVGTSGQGIDFSATPGTGTSELLADYEEGTWTPVIRGDGTAGTYELNAATGANYTKIGRQVTISAFIQLAAAITAGGTGDMQIRGMPFSPSWPTNDFPQGAVVLTGVNFTAGSLSISFAGESPGSIAMYIRSTQVNASVAYVPISGLSAGDVIGFSFTYTASA